ncbi:MAG: M42 family peptidase [Clostridia bacterium]|nr:M42 family peptidase [Clostridia bacterium]
MFELIKKLTEIPAVSGDERQIAAAISEEIAPYTDLRLTDALGNLICLRRGSGKGRRIMFSAHMDEVGFVAIFIEEDGFVRLSPVGRPLPASAAYSEVVFGNGTRGVLVPDADAPSGELKFEKAGVDIGARSAEEAAKSVAVGDRCRLLPGLIKLGDGRVSGRPVSGRVGCAVLIAAAKELASRPERQRDDVFFVFTVQSEVGMRGAGPAAFTVRPDAAITVDAAAAGDAHGAKGKKSGLGSGVGIKVRDGSVICDPGLVGELASAAEAASLPFEYRLTSDGSDDASAVQSSSVGVRTAALSIPVRYIRTGAETADLGDVSACAALVGAFLK